jgi:hypothetical protein
VSWRAVLDDALAASATSWLVKKEPRPRRISVATLPPANSLPDRKLAATRFRASGVPASRDRNRNGSFGHGHRGSRGGPLLGHDDEISVLSRLRTKSLIGDEQGGARGYQRGNALERFRREFDAVKRVGRGLARGFRGR